MLWTQASLRKGLDNGNSGLRKPRDRRRKGEESPWEEMDSKLER